MGGVGLIRELSAGGEGWREASQGRAPSASCLSLPRWKHACSLTWEHLQWDLIKMEMVGMECGGGVFPGFPAASWLLPRSHYIECELTGSRQVHWSS